jgi:hypothetical protein
LRRAAGVGCGPPASARCSGVRNSRWRSRAGGGSVASPDVRSMLRSRRRAPPHADRHASQAAVVHSRSGSTAPSSTSARAASLARVRAAHRGIRAARHLPRDSGHRAGTTAVVAGGHASSAKTLQRLVVQDDGVRHAHGVEGHVHPRESRPGTATHHRRQLGRPCSDARCKARTVPKRHGHIAHDAPQVIEQVE